MAPATEPQGAELLGPNILFLKKKILVSYMQEKYSPKFLILKKLLDSQSLKVLWEKAMVKTNVAVWPKKDSKTKERPGFLTRASSS